jgi:hypothetical protein
MAIGRVVVILSLCVVPQVWADDPFLELYPQYADYCRVPVGLLYAVSRVESGRWVQGKVRPWPWTLNIEGEARYFETRQSQFNALMSALQMGQSVDIGPMQLNWRWQFERLISPWQITDPTFNVLTGCKILRELYDDPGSAGSWHWAVGKYHRRSSAPHHVAAANRYADRVLTYWIDREPKS